MSEENQKIEVSADALYHLLNALMGPPHHIRELQVLSRSKLPIPNPIRTLADEYNQWAEPEK